MAAATQHTPPPNPYNIVEHNNHLKHIKSRHGEQEEEEQQAFEYNHHEDEPPHRSCGGSSRGSLSSSPSHEFSFTVCSLYTSPSTTSSAPAFNKNNFPKESSGLSYSSSTTSDAATAIDLSPADEIFFHGHLLPLHLLSGGQYLSVSPRSSTNSLDSFTLPITSLFSSSSSMDQTPEDGALDNSLDKPKSRSFSLFRNHHVTTAKSRKSPERQETYENRSSKPHSDNHNPTNQHHPKNNLNNKTKFDLSNAIKRYAKLVRPLLVFKPASSSSNSNTSRRESGARQMTRGQTFSYSGNQSPRSNNKQGADHILRAGRFSAPASMRTSPTNSGMLLEASRSNNSSFANSDSTMEELQAAIQAAIAHCKNSSIAAAAAAAAAAASSVQDKI